METKKKWNLVLFWPLTHPLTTGSPILFFAGPLAQKKGEANVIQWRSGGRF
jgi:hypothetical protein